MDVKYNSLTSYKTSYLPVESTANIPSERHK